MGYWNYVTVRVELTDEERSWVGCGGDALSKANARLLIKYSYFEESMNSLDLLCAAWRLQEVLEKGRVKPEDVSHAECLASALEKWGEAGGEIVGCW